MTTTCPDCGHLGIARVPCFSRVEQWADWLRLSPFRCLSCHHRFHAWRVGRNATPCVADRRQHPRIPVRLSLSFSGGRIRGAGMVMDISRGGCVIETDTIVQPHDIYYLQLALEPGRPPVEVAAMVRSVRGRRIGFSFLRSAKEDKRLFDFLHAHGA